MQYARKRDSQACAQSPGITLWHAPVYGWSRHKHAVFEGFMTLGENERPEANWLIELRPYALQRHTRNEYDIDVSQSILSEYWLVTD